MSEEAPTPEVKMANHYYIVAQSLTENANEQLRIADILCQIGDKLCEASIRSHPVTAKEQDATP